MNKFIIFYELSIYLTVTIFISYISADGEEIQTFRNYSSRVFKRQITSNSSVTCTIPPITEDRTFTVKDIEGSVLPVKSKSKVPRLSELTLKCNAGYLTNEGAGTFESVCNSRGVWNPPLKSCYRTCPSLHRTNVDFECTRDGIRVNCNGPLITGTKVYPRCKSLHRPSFKPDYSYLECQDDGEWDNILFKCVTECGIPGEQTLIENGELAPVDGFPWHVAVYKNTVYHILICGGTLITLNMVISAAHCFYNEANKTAVKSPNDYEIAVSKYTRSYNVTDNKYQQILKIRDIIFYDRPYDPGNTNNYGSDIAVVVLKAPITVSSHILPACFAWDESSGFNPGSGVNGVLAGWGRDENGDLSERLSTAQLPYIKYDECVKSIYGLTFDKFCAGSYNGSKASLGDSGGGLIFKNVKDNLYYLRGIVSTSDRFSKLSITTFTDVSIYKDWLQNVRNKLDAELNRLNSEEIDVKQSLEEVVSTSQKPTKPNRRKPTSKTTTELAVDQEDVAESSSTEGWEGSTPRVVFSDDNSEERGGCGKSINNDYKIVDLRKPSLGVWPWMVALISRVRDGKNEVFCTGTLISDQWIMTTAFCAYYLEGNFKETTKARIGGLDVDGSPTGNNRPISVPIHSYTLHPEYSLTPRRNDIALMKLKNRIKLTDHIRPICLLKGDKYLLDDYYDGNVSYAVGYNSGSFSDSQSMFESSLYMFNHTECAKANPDISHWVTIDEKVFCTKRYRKPKCRAYFNGSPIMFLDKVSKTFFQSGIKSYNIPCEDKNKPDFIYVKVAAYADWIHKTIKPSFFGHLLKGASR